MREKQNLDAFFIWNAYLFDQIRMSKSGKMLGALEVAS